MSAEPGRLVLGLAPLLLAACDAGRLEGFWIDLSGRVVDADGAPLADATVDLAASDGTPIAEVIADADGAWEVPLHGVARTGNVLVALIRAEGFAEGRATLALDLQTPEEVPLAAGPVQTWSATARRVPAFRLAPEGGPATVTGRLLDATDGRPVAKVQLALQRGWNALSDDPIVATAVTGESGAFAFEAGWGGMYTVVAEATDETGAARFPALLTPAGGTATGLVAPELPDGELRAALSWGPAPRDLDLHLSAPIRGGSAGADGTGRYQVWAEEPAHPDLGADAGGEAWMERTDADGAGPESARVAVFASSGEARISVYDNDNRSERGSEALAGSGAVVQVWYGDTRAYFDVAPGEVGTLWRPVEIDIVSGVQYAVEAWSEGADPSDADAF